MNKYSMSQKLNWAEEVLKDTANGGEIINNKLHLFIGETYLPSSERVIFNLENETVDWVVDLDRWFVEEDFCSEGVKSYEYKPTLEDIKFLKEYYYFNDVEKLKGMDNIISFFNTHDDRGLPYAITGYKSLPDIKDFCPIEKDVIYHTTQNLSKLKIEDTKSNGVCIIPIDLNTPIIFIEPIDNSKENKYIFLVDIQDKDEFKYKTEIETTQDLNKAIDVTIDMLNNHPIFNKYIDDIEELKQ